jgi:hypothetical protein
MTLDNPGPLQKPNLADWQPIGQVGLVWRNSLADQRRYPRAILICAPVIITYESFQLCRDSTANGVERHHAPVAASRCLPRHDVVQLSLHLPAGNQPRASKGPFRNPP